MLNPQDGAELKGVDWVGRLLAVCAVAVTFLLAVRVLSPEPVQTQKVAGRSPPEPVKNWKSLHGNGSRIGSTAAQVTILEFTDLQCPVCRVFGRIVDSARARYGDTLAIEVVHYPLASIHPQAIAAARASECARAQGKFGEFISTAFKFQDSLGTKPWTQLASVAGVSNLRRFADCQADTTQVASIRRGQALGDSLKITGTPTLIINGWRFGGSMGTARLDSVIRGILAEQRKSH